MARGRWITVTLAVLAAGIAAAIVASPSGAAAPRPRLCLLGCSTTTTTTTTQAPTTTQPPVPGAVTVSALTATTAHLSAPLNTGGQSVDYGWSFDGPPRGVTVTGLYTAPAEPNPTTVAFDDTGLTPNSTYHARLDAGDVSGPATTFTTPILPALPLSLREGHSQILYGNLLALTATVHGAGRIDTNDVVHFQLKLPDGRWANQRNFGPGSVDRGLPASDQVSVRIGPSRNTRLRAELVGTNALDGTTKMRRPSYSPSIPVLVYPRVSGGIGRVNDGPDLEISYDAYVHGLPQGYRGETVYFYTGAPGARTLHLLGGRRLSYRVTRGPELVASYTFRDLDGASGASCVRHALLPDMGLPFTFSACGKPTLTVP